MKQRYEELKGEKERIDLELKAVESYLKTMGVLKPTKKGRPKKEA